MTNTNISNVESYNLICIKDKILQVLNDNPITYNEMNEIINYLMQLKNNATLTFNKTNIIKDESIDRLPNIALTIENTQKIAEDITWY